MNPCPCGWLGAGPATGRQCRCAPDQVTRYQSRLSGPLLDRIDMQVEVPALPPGELLQGAPGEATAPVAARVAQVRALAARRQGGLPNAQLAAGQLDSLCQVEPAARTFLETAATRLGWSGRSLHRVIKLARTIADLAGSPTVAVAHVAEAIQYRRALPGA